MSSSEILKHAAVKCTKQRVSVLDLLLQSDKPLTAEEIHEQISDNHDTDDIIHLSTIYRILALLTEKDVLLRIIHKDGTACYSVKKDAHTHCLRCSICNKKVKIKNCPLQDLINELKETTGFEITDHRLEMIGICPDCAKRMADNKKK